MRLTSNPFIRVQALQALVALSAREAVPHLIGLAEDIHNFPVRREAVVHLLEWEINSLPALSALARFARDYPEDNLQPSDYDLLNRHNFEQGQDFPPLETTTPRLIPPSLPMISQIY